MRIALIGTRGIPPRYGGFETCVYEIGRRLARKGHEVTVYCRSGYYHERPRELEGMRLVYLPNAPLKTLDTLSHTCLSLCHAVCHRHDVLMVFNAANSPLLLLPRLLGHAIVINTDGLEWKRRKWGPLGRTYYKACERVAACLAHRLVADSSCIGDYYRQAYGIRAARIAYGATPMQSTDTRLLAPLGVEPGRYVLQVTRFEPENNPLLTVSAFARLQTDLKLVLVGDVPYRSRYATAVTDAAGPNVVLPGSIYRKDLLAELWRNCAAYVHANEVGGTNPALLQAMANGCATLAIDVPFNREVLGDAGWFFTAEASDLADRLGEVLHSPDERRTRGEQARRRCKEHYDWDNVSDAYLALFEDVVRHRSAGA
ncbi:glycosyltransferase [bacterium]|nr:glycosyltransferase [bacterium]